MARPWLKDGQGQQWRPLKTQGNAERTEPYVTYVRVDSENDPTPEVATVRQISEAYGDVVTLPHPIGD